MVTCENCKAQVEESLFFCSSCGSKIIKPVTCAECGYQTSSEFAFSQNCGKPLGTGPAAAPAAAAEAPKPEETPKAEPDNVLKAESVSTVIPEPGNVHKAEPASAVITEPENILKAEPESASKTEPESDTKASVDMQGILKKVSSLFRGKRLIAICAAAAVCAAVALLLILNPFGGRARNSSLLYFKDKELNFTFLPRVNPITVTDKLFADNDIYMSEMVVQYNYGTILTSNDGRYIFYPDNLKNDDTCTYYCRDLSRDNSKEDTAVKIDSDIYLTDPKVLSDDGRKFFYLKGSDRRFYCYDMRDKIKIDNDVEYFYINAAGDYTVYIKTDGTIYEMDLKNGNQKNKIDSDASIVRVINDANRVYYLKEGTLYLKDRDKDKEKISSDIYTVYSIIDGKGVYYTKYESNTYSLMDYVLDDLYAFDSKLTEPYYPDYSDYMVEVWVESYWGSTWNEELEEWGYWDRSVDWDAYDAAVDQYYEDLEAYNEKLDRDWMREQLIENEVTQDNISLYYYDGEKETMITENIAYLNEWSDLCTAVVYTKYDIQDKEVEKFKLSELYSVDDVWNLAYSFLYSSESVHMAFEGEEISFTETKASSFYFSPKGDALYFLEDYSLDNGYGTLMKMEIKDGKVQSPVKVEDDVSDFRFGNGPESDLLFCFKDEKYGSGDVYVDGKIIATDVYTESLYNYAGSQTIVYLGDYDTDKEKGTLYILRAGKPEKIAEDVSGFVTDGENSIVYIVDYNAKKQKGDAYLYNGSSKPVLIDTGVSALIWKSEWIDYYSLYNRW